MHDYQLERLNTRSFEQLIQALGIEILGPQLMIFGDGPDGGREATFDGAVNYPEAPKTWNGYGIVQAKFRQQPDSQAKKNADWAIQQLKLEFQKLKPIPKRNKTTASNNRICPEYYIFATNLSLSPVAQTGGKDRVRALLDGFKKSHGLKDYAIWDCDQIRRFLDAKPGIRTTYTAWLLPGDVLAEMMKVLKLDKTDFPSTIRRYLESELLDDQFARLGQGGYTDAKNIPLCSVFVDLPVDIQDEAFASQSRTIRAIPDDEGTEDEQNQQKNPCTFFQLFFEEGRQVLKPTVIRNRLVGQKTRIDQTGRVVLIGGPGQGKTTVGQFACQLYRVELLRATGGSFSPEVSQAIELIEKMSDGFPPVCARRYPLRVDLKHFASSLAATGEDNTKSLFDFLVKRISNRTNSTVSPDSFRRWLGGYPWVLVLDGLDEVPASSNRQQVMQAVRDFISIEAYGVDADLLVLATTRPQGYSDEFDPSFYHHLSLAPLKAEEALAYGLLLAKARHPGQLTRVEALAASLKRATGNPATVRLMQSPLQVTIMLALIEGGGEPPEQRWKLFHDYYDVIYRREKERGTSFSAILGSYEPDIHWIHHRAGWSLQQRNALLGSTDARFTHEEFEKLVDKRLLDSGHEDATKRGELVRAIRTAATDRLVFLVGNTEKEIGFEIRSLQEFMAAEHFFDGGEACVQKTLHDIAPYPYWRNVFLFAAGRVFFERQVLIDCIITICGEMNDDPNDPAQGAIFSGSRLALALLKDGAARNQPRYIRVIARCAARSLDAREDDVITAFSEIFSGETEEVWKEELSKRLIAAGTAFPQQNWLLCLRLVGMGKPWAHELMMNHFPWKSEAVREFIANSGPVGRRLPEAFWSEVVRHLPEFPPSIFFWFLWTAGNLPRPLEVELLKQFFPLFQHECGELWSLHCARELTGISFRLQGIKSLRIWAGFQYPEQSQQNIHSEWRVCQAVSAFARKPTKSNLADQLVVISQIDPDALFSHWGLPWQIAVCLSARNAGHSWNEIVSSVNKGNMGNEGDWTRWEEQNKKNLRLSQFRSLDDLTITDEFQGTILQKTGWSFSANEEQVIEFVEELSNALIKWPEIRNQQRLIDLCCHAICRLAQPPFTMHQEVIAWFVTTCAENNIPLTSSVVAAILINRLAISDKLTLLGRIGRCLIKPGLGFDDRERNVTDLNEQVRAVIEALQTVQDWWNVLRTLSFLPPLDAMQTIPEYLLQQINLKGEAFSKAAFVLKLNCLRWDVNESAEAVHEALALKKDYPDHLNNLFDFIDSCGESGLSLETFLVEFLKQPMADLDARMLNRATSLLVKLVERRPAINSLPDPAVRSQLG